MDIVWYLFPNLVCTRVARCVTLMHVCISVDLVRGNHFDLACQVVRDAYTRIAREVITSMRDAYPRIAREAITSMRDAYPWTRIRYMFNYSYFLLRGRSIRGQTIG